MHTYISKRRSCPTSKSSPSAKSLSKSLYITKLVAGDVEQTKIANIRQVTYKQRHIGCSCIFTLNGTKNICTNDSPKENNTNTWVVIICPIFLPIGGVHLTTSL